jgi:hypothetical protein
MPDVRTTLQPGSISTVSEQEFTDLDRQGLILEVVTQPVSPVTSTAKVKVVSAGKVKPEPEEA